MCSWIRNSLKNTPKLKKNTSEQQRCSKMIGRRVLFLLLILKQDLYICGCYPQRLWLSSASNLRFSIGIYGFSLIFPGITQDDLQDRVTGMCIPLLTLWLWLPLLIGCWCGNKTAVLGFVRPHLSAFSSHGWYLKPHHDWIRQKWWEVVSGKISPADRRKCLIFLRKSRVKQSIALCASLSIHLWGRWA